MFLESISIRKPVTVSSCILMLVLFGLTAWSRLGLEAFPETESSHVTVTAVYPGANPAEIESEVAGDLEDAVGAIDGVQAMHTACMENVCRITLEFEPGRSADAAAQDVRERIDRILPELPPGVEPPIVAKYDPDAAPVVALMLTGDLPLDKLYDFADETLRVKFSSLSGVAGVRIAGGEPLELRITLDTEALTAAGLTVNEVLTKLRESNLRLPVGRIRQDQQEVNVTYDSEFKSLDEIGALEIGMFEKRRVYLRDVAQITMESAEKRTLAFYDGEPAVLLKIIKKGDANTMRVVDHVNAAIAELEQDRLLPSGMKLVRVQDAGGFIRAATGNAWLTMGLGVVLVALGMLLFLRDGRRVIAAAVSLPVSVVISLPILELCGYSFNAFTLPALGISVGTLAACSIPVVESRMKRSGDENSPGAASQVAVASLAVVAVFVPVAMTLSPAGHTLAPFAIAAGAAALASLLVNVTLTPILADVPPGGNRRPTAEGRTGWLELGFDRSLEFVCRHRGWAVLFGIVLFAGALVLLPARTGMTFLPECDRGEFRIRLEFPAGYNLDSTRERTMQIESRLRKLPDVEATSTVIGQIQGDPGQNTEGVNLAEITIVAKPQTGRGATLEELREMFRNELRDLTDCRATVTVPSPFGEPLSSFELELAGNNLDTLETLAAQGVKTLKAHPAARDVDSSVHVGKPGIRVVPERTAMQNLGIASSSVGTLLRGSIEGLKAGSGKIGSRTFDIRVKLDERTGYNQLPALPFRSKQGKPLRLGTVTELRASTTPTRIDRSDRRRTVKLFANPAPCSTPGDLAEAAEKTIAPELPPGYRMTFTGTIREMRETFTANGHTAVMAVLLLYLLLAAIQGSWRAPLPVLLVLPAALAGVFAALRLSGLALSIPGALGAMTVAGVALAGAYLLVECARRKQAAGLAPAEAMRLAVKEKFRTVLMTGFAVILGVAPMAFGPGTGAELRASCAVPVIGGIIGSTVFGLYLLPALYALFARGRNGRNG